MNPSDHPASAIDSVTQLLAQAKAGDEDAWNRIYAVLYAELRQIARSQLKARREGGSPTSLISAAWLKLAEASTTAENRMHLVGLMGHAMRYSLLDQAKAHLAAKRGGGLQHSSLDDIDVPSSGLSPEQFVELDKALRYLGEIDPRLETIVELRYFCGFTDREIGEFLGITARTVRREWSTARSYLITQMSSPGADSGFGLGPDR